MAVREMRASWRRLLFFFICLSIGVGAIVAIRSVIQSVRGVFAGEARALISADAIISSNQPFDPEARREDRRAACAASAQPAISPSRSRRWCEPPTGRSTATRMVELRAVEPAFPFYGELKLADGQPFTHDLLAELRRAGEARTAGATGAVGRRRAADRHAAVHDSRRHRVRAGPPARRVQPRPARVHQLRAISGRPGC